MIFRRIFSIFIKNERKMSKLFKSKVNPVTGAAEWDIEPEDYDFYQEIARSSYADMLHDHERNVLYQAALKNVIESLKPKIQHVHVVDIGTGTGLLSMMAVKFGADHVTAIEAFDPIALTARKVIELNGMSSKINVVSKRSTDFVDGELKERADVAVAEVFDTELIGEGALSTFFEAHKKLLKKNCRVIPARGRIYVQVVESDVALRWVKLTDFQLPEHKVHLRVPDVCAECPGTASVHDIQVNQFPQNYFKIVSDPVLVFDFNFESEEIPFEEQITKEFTVKSGINRADGLLMWWELDMDGSGQLILSTQPKWSADSQWRDHWMQALYYFPKSVDVKSCRTLRLHASHDEYSLWFSASNAVDQKSDAPTFYNSPVCKCGMHILLSRTNIARFNDLQRYKLFSELFSGSVSGKRCLSVTDCSVLPIVALQLGAKEVVSLEANPMAFQIIRMFAKSNKCCDDSLKLISCLSEIANEKKKFDVVFSECFFLSSILPWHNLHLWYVFDDLRTQGALSDSFLLCPSRAELVCMPLQFDDLHKIRAPVGSVEGFNLKPFDDIVQCDANVEPQPLWEYPSLSLSDAQTLLKFDFAKSPCNTHSSLKIPLLRELTCNGIAIWMDWYCGDRLIISGLRRTCSVGDKPDWEWSHCQGVHFPKKMPHENLTLVADVRFSSKDGEIFFDFHFEN